jgi:hypothetical protein
VELEIRSLFQHLHGTLRGSGLDDVSRTSAKRPLLCALLPSDYMFVLPWLIFLPRSLVLHVRFSIPIIVTCCHERRSLLPPAASLVITASNTMALATLSVRLSSSACSRCRPSKVDWLTQYFYSARGTARRQRALVVRCDGWSRWPGCMRHIESIRQRRHGSGDR